MGVLQKISFMIDHAAVVLWYMQLLQELFCTGIQKNNYIHRSHPAWFDAYKSPLSMEYNHTPGYLPLQKYC